MTDSDYVRYASVQQLADALDVRVDTVDEEMFKRRLAAATDTFVSRTGRAFHPVRIGIAAEPRTWEQHDAQNIGRPPVTVDLKRSHVLPIDDTEGDTIEIRTGRDNYDDVTDQEGRQWSMDYERGRLTVHRLLINRAYWERPSQRYLRLTYRFGPLRTDTEVGEDGLVEGVPNDVSDAIAARAAERLALNDETSVALPDDGQLSSRGQKRDQLEREWEDAISRYADVRVV